MTGDDLRKIFLGRTLFRLDTVLSPRLVPILYASGLGALLLWAITHLFATFGRNFGDGLWGLLEIVVFGLLGSSRCASSARCCWSSSRRTRPRPRPSR